MCTVHARSVRNAVIDLGSNTFHALAVEVGGPVVLDKKIAVRIGEHAFEPRWIPDDAYTRGLDALGMLLAEIRALDCDRCAIIATGIFREASNGRRFLAEARGRFGVAIDLLDGHEEAHLTWLAVSAELGASHGRLAVIDLGGGSLECVVGVSDVEIAHSLPLGVLRLRNHHPDDIRELVVATAQHAVDQIRVLAPDTFALSSGTARALLRLGRALGRIEPLVCKIAGADFAELAKRLEVLSPVSLGELDIDPARRDTIGTGAIVFDTILKQFGRPTIYVAKAALREGALLMLARSSPFRAPPRSVSRLGELVTGV